ncbi:MAG: hypothetical protein LBC55_06685 [Desulfovibrio sp.]|jgi:hypothetical protein|nr:hypothetical protein [Desulfovibrio sp.]
MLSSREVKFAEGFLAALTMQDFTEFPFANSDFREGVAKMEEYIFSSYQGEADASDLDLLFSKTPVTGDFTRFIAVLDLLNGKRISVENSYLSRATIKMSRDIAESILESQALEFRKMVTGAARAFINGIVQ